VDEGRGADTQDARAREDKDRDRAKAEAERGSDVSSGVNAGRGSEVLATTPLGYSRAGGIAAHACGGEAGLTWRAARPTEKAARRPREMGWYISVLRQ
jgi:hypothetical protein